MDTDEARLRERVDGLARRFGPLHIETTAVRNDLAQHLHDLGRMAEAEEQYRLACDGLARHFGSSHMFTLSCMNNLAIVLRDRGRAREALDVLGVVHQERLRQAGPAHPLTVNTAMSLLDILVDVGDVDTGLARFRELHALCAAEWGPDHETTVAVRFRLAEVLRRAGQHGEAARLVGAPEARPVGQVLLGCARELRYAGMCPVALTASRYGAEVTLGVHDRVRALLAPGEQGYDAESGVRLRVVSPESLTRPYRLDVDWLAIADRVADAVGALAEHFLVAEQNLGGDALRVRVRLHHQAWPEVSMAPTLTLDRRVMSRRARAAHDRLLRNDFAAMSEVTEPGFTGYVPEGSDILVSTEHGVAGTPEPGEYEA